MQCMRNNPEKSYVQLKDNLCIYWIENFALSDVRYFVLIGDQFLSDRMRINAYESQISCLTQKKSNQVNGRFEQKKIIIYH